MLVKSNPIYPIILNDNAVPVPQNYIGLTFNGFPTNPSNPGAPEPAPQFNYGGFRTLDSGKGRFFWARLNPSNGVYDWNDLDDYMNYFAGLGKDCWFTLHSTPSWCASTTTLDPEGMVGGGSMPTSMTHVTTFITALCNRYLGQLTHLEIWNEPNMAAGTFWEGTAAQLVTLGKTVRDAAKAVDPSIIVLSPGFNHLTPMNTWLAAQDPVSGQFGYQIIDGLAFHPYTGTASYFDNINYASDPPRMYGAIYYKGRYGIPSIPVYVSEYGISGSVDATIAAFLALPAEERRARIGRTLAIYAAMGAQSFYLYQYSAVQFLCGDLVTDTNGVVAGVNDFYQVCGKTIKARGAKFWQDGSISIETTDNRLYNF